MAFAPAYKNVCANMGTQPFTASAATPRESAMSRRAACLAALTSRAAAGDVAALTYTSLLGGAAAYGVFFYNASKGNLTKLSSLTFLTPMFATFAGYLILDERLSLLQITGATITLSGVLLMNVKASAAKSD